VEDISVRRTRLASHPRRSQCFDGDGNGATVAGFKALTRSDRPDVTLSS